MERLQKPDLPFSFLMRGLSNTEDVKLPFIPRIRSAGGQPAR